MVSPFSAAKTTSRPSGDSAIAVRPGRGAPSDSTSWSAGRRFICNDVSGAATVDRRGNSHPIAPPAPTAAISSGANRRHGRPAAAVGSAPDVSDGVTVLDAAIVLAGTPATREMPLSDAFSDSRNRATATSLMRAVRSLSRQRWISVTTCGGTSAGSAVQSGVVFITEAIVSAMSSPANARFAVSIS